MGRLARKMVFTVAGTAASRLVRRGTRRVVTNGIGTKLQRRMRGSGLATGLLWVAGAAAAMALADVCTEQARRAIS